MVRSQEQLAALHVLRTPLCLPVKNSAQLSLRLMRADVVVLLIGLVSYYTLRSATYICYAICMSPRLLKHGQDTSRAYNGLLF